MKPTLKSSSIVLTSALLLSACGGSGTSESGSQVNDPLVSTQSGQMSDDMGSQVTAEGLADSADNAGNAQPDIPENSDQQVANDFVDSSPSSNQSVDGTLEAPDSVSDESATSDVSNNESTNQVIVSGETYRNSFCVEPEANAVSYEDFYRSRNFAVRGVYVPFPASGFGWDGTKLCDLEGSRELDEIEVLVPYVKQRPDTDGVIAFREWVEAANAGTYNYETRGNDIDNLLLAPVSRYQDGAGYSEWWAMHDATNLYLRIRVSNDAITQVYSDSDDPWHDDSIELYIDGDNSKGDLYDGVNDFQVLLTADNDRLPFIPGNAPDGLRIFHRSGGDFAYDIEVTINLESAGIEIGRPFGFDIHINEDDNGDERDAKWGWFEKSGFDRSWFQPSTLGTLLLTDCENRDQCGRYQTLSP